MAIALGMTLPTMVPHGREEVLAWCRGIDEGPWSTLAVPERVTYTSHSLTVQLSAAAALTARVRLWTTIVILPAHPTAQVAKDLASVDRLSNGRLTVGVGVGGRDHDYRALEAPFERRWARMDEQVGRLRSLWAQEPPFEGADPVGPPPVQPGGPPFNAGVMGPKAMARAARWADGIDHGGSILGLQREPAPASFLGFDRDALAGVVARAREAWAGAGRADAPYVSASVWYALGPDAEATLRRYAYEYLRITDDGFARMAAQSVTCFTPEMLRDTAAEMEAAGVDQLMLVPASADVAQLHRAADTLG